MRKIPISGGPHTGKTTLLNALKLEYPEACFVEEPAERVIAAELKREEEGQSYQGTFPWNNYPAFARLVVDESLTLEAAIPPDADIVFQDRSLVDNIGYGRLNGYEDLIEEVELHTRLARYAFALFCEPVGTYTQTVVRRETLEEAQTTHQHLSVAYRESGLSVVHLPAVSTEVAVNTEARLAIVREQIG